MSLADELRLELRVIMLAEARFKFFLGEHARADQFPQAWQTAVEEARADLTRGAA